MSKNYSSYPMSRLCLMSFLFLCSLFLSDNAFCRKNWNGDYTKVSYNPTRNSITFTFEVYDYQFGPLQESGYLRWCDFFFTTDGENYTHLMRTETDNQRDLGWTWLKMRYKRIGTQLQFIGCRRPESGVMWPDNGQDALVDVNNAFDYALGKLHIGHKAFFTVRWFLGETYKDVKRIRLNGFWKVNGVYKGDNINNVYYDIPSKSMLKSTVSHSENNRVKVTTQADAIVVTGANAGEQIKVYNVSGVEVKSIVTQSDVVNIQLAKNQVYIVNVGQARYKVAL